MIKIREAQSNYENVTGVAGWPKQATYFDHQLLEDYPWINKSSLETELTYKNDRKSNDHMQSTPTCSCCCCG